MEFDVFVSHASEDKAYVEPLVRSLESAGIRVWYDALTLEWGDDLRGAIDRGLAKSRFGVVIFSPSFLRRKKWTEYELSSLFSKESTQGKVVLPIWHGITRDDLLQYSPGFADRLAKISGSDTHEDIVESLLRLLGNIEVTSQCAREEPPKSEKSLKNGIKYSNENKHVLRQLQRLLEIVVDAGFYRSDTEFANSGGTINYIFDENVFDSFINPRRNPDYGALFHQRDFEERKSDTETRNHYNGQSTLLATEYLFSALLPGQRDGVSYITDGHRFELYHRVSTLSERHISNGSALYWLAHRYLQILSELKTAELSETTNAIDAVAQGLNETIMNDARELVRRGIPERVSRQYISTRILVHVLSEDAQVAPLIQQRRLYSQEFLEKLTPLSDLLNAGDREIANLRADSDQWMEHLGREQGGKSAGRPQMALRNDAEALAQATYVSRARERHGEKTVFVTGDALIYNAYRRWHINSKGNEPFIVRRVKQYAPLLNIEDPVTGEQNDLWPLERGVSSALRGFNIAPLPSADYETEAKARRHLAMVIDDYLDGRSNSPVSKAAGDILSMFKLNESWFTDHASLFEEMRQLWQHVERILLGSRSDLMRDRVRHSRLDGLDLGHDESAMKPAVQAWVESLLDEIADGSARLSFPLALESILKGRVARRRSATTGQPSPFLLRFTGPPDEFGNALTLDFADLERRLSALKDLRSVGDVLTEGEKSLLQTRDIAFGVAASLALRQGHWMDAERFADLAVQIVRSTARNSDSNVLQEARALEFLYLQALVRRARVMNTNVSGLHAADPPDEFKIRVSAHRMDDISYRHLRNGEPIRALRAIHESVAGTLTYLKILLVRNAGKPVRADGVIGEYIWRTMRVSAHALGLSATQVDGEFQNEEEIARTRIEEESLAAFALSRVLMRRLLGREGEKSPVFARIGQGQYLDNIRDIYNRISRSTLDGPGRAYIILHEHLFSEEESSDGGVPEDARQGLKETYTLLDHEFAAALLF